MKVIQEKLPASQIGLEIEVTSEMSKKVYERVVQEFIRSTSIPGFRKGKVPRQVLIQRIGASRIKAAAVEELVEDGLKEAVKQENIEVLGNYQLRSSFDELVSQFEPGQTLTFSASVDVQPEATLRQYTELQLQAEEVKPTAKQIDTVFKDYQEQLATLVPVESRPAQMSDVAVVDFKGVLPSDDPDQEPEAVPGGEAQDFQLELLEGRFIEGFIDGIVGMAPGETKEIEAKFPDTYPQPVVAGRKALFTVTLKELKEKELPELDDDFAQEVSEFETLAEFRQSLETRFAKEAADKTRSNQEQAILKELVNQIEVEVPETLVDREVNFMLQQTVMQLQNQGVDIKQLFTQEMVARLREQSRPDAINRIKRTLALGEIAKRESISASPDEISAKVNEVLESLGKQSEEIDPERLQTVVAEDVLKEKIVDWLIEHSTIELVPEGTLTPAVEDLDVDELDVDELDAVTSETMSSETALEPQTATIDVPATEVTETAEVLTDSANAASFEVETDADEGEDAIAADEEAGATPATDAPKTARRRANTD